MTDRNPDVDIAAALRPWSLLLVLAVVCVWFGTLDARHLLRSDEGRYAEIAREMWVSGDWVTPRYNELKYFEKPPAHLWMTAVAYELFGLGEWQARLWVALNGAAGLLLTMLAAWRWWGPRVASLTGMVLLATPSWNIAAHFNSLDMSVSGALAAVLACTLLAQHPECDARLRRRWMLAAWCAMGVAVMTKGLIGLVLPGLALMVYTLWTRDLQIWRRLHIVTGTVLMLLIAAPWFWLVSQRNPEFPSFFFIHEHLQRYTSGIHQRGAPFWYFLPQLLVGFLPWLGLWPDMAVQTWREPRAPGLRPIALLAAWALSIFVFFSASGSKLPGYIIPMMPAVAVLAALALDRMTARAWTRQLLGAQIVAVLVAAVSPFTARLSSASTSNALFRAYAPWLTVAALVLLAGVLCAAWLNRQGRQQASMVAYALTMFVGITIGMIGHETLGRSASGIDLVAPIQAVLKPGMPIYGVKYLDHTLPFYLQHPLTMVESPDELEFGVQQEPQKWLPTLAAFRNRWREAAPALAMMSYDTYEQLRTEGLPMNTIAADSRRIVVANFRRGVP